MNDRHIADDAALYALGALDDESRRSIDRHVAGCDACTRLLSAAERDVALMAASELQHVPPGGLRAFKAPAPAARAAWQTWGALAAVLLVGILPSAYFWQQNQTMHDAMQSDADAMNRLGGTSFRTAEFTGREGGPAARVMYAPDGSWYVVLVRSASKDLQVAWMHDGQRTMLGAARPHGDVAMLYLPKSHRMDRLALVDGESVVAEAKLAY